MTKEELRDKIAWEGSVMDAVEYGIKLEDFPEDTPAEVTDAWYQLQEATRYIDTVYRWLEQE